MILRLLLKRKCGLGLVPKPAFTYHKNITPDKINCAVASHVIVSFQMDADDDGSDIEFWLGWWLCLKSKHVSFSGTHPNLYVYSCPKHTFPVLSPFPTQGSLKGCSRVAQGLFKGCSRVAQGLLKGCSRVAQGLLKCCSRVVFFLYTLNLQVCRLDETTSINLPCEWLSCAIGLQRSYHVRISYVNVCGCMCSWSRCLSW